MKDLNTNQKIAIAAILAVVLVAGLFWYTSPFNQCVRANIMDTYMDHDAAVRHCSRTMKDG
jgi:hypothetical protein